MFKKIMATVGLILAGITATAQTVRTFPAEETVNVFKQQNSFSQINNILYAGSFTYPTAQGAVTVACALSAAATVDLPIGTNIGVDPTTLTGCTAVGIVDHRTTVPAYYLYQSGAYVIQSSGGGGAGNPASPAFAVQIANSGVTGFAADAKININPTTHTLTSQIINGIGNTESYNTSNNGIANSVASNFCTSGCLVTTPQTSSSTEIPVAYTETSNLLPGPLGSHTVDYRGGGQVDTWNTPANPITSVGAPSISGSFAGAYLGFMNQARAVPNQTFPDYGFSYYLMNFLAGGNNISQVGGPGFKSNYGINAYFANFYEPGQHGAINANINCWTEGDCRGGFQSFTQMVGSAGDISDELGHLAANSMVQPANVYLGNCTSGCTIGSKSVSLSGSATNAIIGTGLWLDDQTHQTLSSTAGCHIASAGEQGVPLSTVTLAGTSCAPVSSMFLAASAAICGSNYPAGACGATNQAIATSGLPTSFLSSTSGIPSTGYACVATSSPGTGGDAFEMDSYTVVDSTHIQLTYTKPHFNPAVISVGGWCGRHLIPNANINGTVASIVSAANTYQALAVVGCVTANFCYLGDYAQIASVVGPHSKVFYAQYSPISYTRVSNVVTVSASFGNTRFNQLKATIAGATDSSFNCSACTVTQLSFGGTFSYPSTGTNGTTTGGMVTFDYAEYTVVPAAHIASVLNPTTETMDLGNITLEANGIDFSTNPTLTVPPGSQLNISGSGPFSEIVQYNPGVDFGDPGYGGAGQGMIWGGNPGPFLTGEKQWNVASPTIYTDFGGTLSPPRAAFGSEGVWQYNFVGDAGLFGFASLFCHPMPVGCSGFDSGYALFNLQQSDSGDITNIFFDLKSNTISLNTSSSTPLTLAVTNLTATGTVNLANLLFPNGVVLSPNLTLPSPFNTGTDGRNIAFKDFSGTIRQVLGLQDIVSNETGLVIGNCNPGKGGIPNCAPDSGSTLDLGILRSSFQSLLNGISVGLGLPTPFPIGVAANPGTHSYIYEYEAKNVDGIFTPPGIGSDGVSTAALGGSNTITIPCPGALQNGYPAGTTYELFRLDNGGGGGNVDLGTCTVGTNFVDDGSITTAAVFATTNYTANLGADTVLARQFRTTGTGASILTGTSANTDLAGSVTLVGGTFTYTLAQAKTTAPIVTCTDTSVTPTVVNCHATTTTIVFNGTGTDVISYISIGLN